jgi:dipeptidyl aminopeptidase/acylaminoacyl peptidase
LDVWQVPIASAPHAEAAQRKLISDPAYQVWQSHFSPDGRWIAFEGVTNSTNVESSIFVVPATGGGPWTRITGGPQWDDKPRWSPDGKRLYFISNREGRVFNLWGIDFDPLRGKTVGEPFRLTSFAPPGPLLGAPGRPELALTEDSLIMTIQERSGNIWILDNVDR